MAELVGKREERRGRCCLAAPKNSTGTVAVAVLACSIDADVGAALADAALAARPEGLMAAVVDAPDRLSSAHPAAAASGPPVSVEVQLQMSSAPVFVQYHEYFQKLHLDMQVGPPPHLAGRSEPGLPFDGLRPPSPTVAAP